MREFELLIDEALKNGLSPEQMTPFNSQLLYGCLGFRCGKLGLEAALLGENPLPVGIDLYYNWPYPQVLIGDTYNILIIRNLITNADYIYTISDDYLTVTLIATLSHGVYGVGSLMELADFGEYAFMTNGVAMVYWDTTGIDWDVVVVDADIPMMRTVCNLNGQAVGGNIVSVWYDCDETFYIWSKIGSMDFTPEQGNEAGYRRCPYGGEVFHVRKLGTNVIGYSSKGITLMKPVNDPVPGFGFVESYNLGLINRGAVDGCTMDHLFVDEDYNLVRVNEKGPAVLGYQHYVRQLSNEDIIVNYDPASGDYYIGNSAKTFLLSPEGLTEVTQHPSAVWKGDIDGTFMLPDTVDEDSPHIITEAFDMQYKGQKTISVIETDAFSVIGAEAAVDYAFDLTNWVSGNFIPINNMGVGTVIAAGNMFRFKLRFSEISDDFRIGYIGVRYKMTDLRGIRGVYAPPIRGQR
uniref:Uncharacterized protein n=1 Tax=viral metagenome TaxID=1070528 RepID=A0A6M3IH74_9ZZZZ